MLINRKLLLFFLFMFCFGILHVYSQGIEVGLTTGVGIPIGKFSNLQSYYSDCSGNSPNVPKSNLSPSTYIEPSVVYSFYKNFGVGLGFSHLKSTDKKLTLAVNTSDYLNTNSAVSRAFPQIENYYFFLILNYAKQIVGNFYMFFRMRPGISFVKYNIFVYQTNPQSILTSEITSKPALSMSASLGFRYFFYDNFSFHVQATPQITVIDYNHNAYSYFYGMCFPQDDTNVSPVYLIIHGGISYMF